MRLESATVPAAVMPDRSCDDGFINSCHCPDNRMGRLYKIGISQKTCRTNWYSKLSGWKARSDVYFPFLFPFCREYLM